MENEMGKDLKIQVERIQRLDGKGSLKGFADISIANTFLIKGLKIVAGKEGLFVGMPSKQGKDGNWYNIIMLLNKEVKQQLSDLVISAYEE